ncbi:Fic family protein [Bengtsoniella intestinalis]|uniref:Fic family protein n=1 Tax=Bengtsoniella intestinalis TaxID=3073143 RepID=UPI00391F20B3
MNFLSVAQIAVKWGVSERSVRNYCAQGRIDGAFLTGKTWNVPEHAVKPTHGNKKQKTSDTLLDVLCNEQSAKISGGIYHKIQIELTYNSNHIEGSRLTHDQTRYIFETNTIGGDNEVMNVDDIVETANHFKCIDMVIAQAGNALSEKLIKQLHFTLKHGTSDSRKDWFVTGDYKKLPNEVGGQETTSPEDVSQAIQALLSDYNATKEKAFEDIVAFHVAFESIHPFQDGNGRVGRLIMLKECLRNNVTPFIIGEQTKMFYYRGLHEWKRERGFLLDTCLSAQDQFKAYLDYFKVPYSD